VAAYTSYGSADKIIRRLTAYEVYGGLWRLTAAARGSRWNGVLSQLINVFRGVHQGVYFPLFVSIFM